VKAQLLGNDSECVLVGDAIVPLDYYADLFRLRCPPIGGMPTWEGRRCLPAPERESGDRLLFHQPFESTWGRWHLAIWLRHFIRKHFPLSRGALLPLDQFLSEIGPSR